MWLGNWEGAFETIVPNAVLQISLGIYIYMPNNKVSWRKAGLTASKDILQCFRLDWTDLQSIAKLNVTDSLVNQGFGFCLATPVIEQESSSIAQFPCCTKERLVEQLHEEVAEFQDNHHAAARFLRKALTSLRKGLHCESTHWNC